MEESWYLTSIYLLTVCMVVDVANAVQCPKDFYWLEPTGNCERCSDLCYFGSSEGYKAKCAEVCPYYVVTPTPSPVAPFEGLGYPDIPLSIGISSAAAVTVTIAILAVIFRKNIHNVLLSCLHLVTREKLTTPHQERGNAPQMADEENEDGNENAPDARRNGSRAFIPSVEEIDETTGAERDHPQTDGPESPSSQPLLDDYEDSAETGAESVGSSVESYADSSFGSTITT